jgi:hypothetical protein
LFHSLLLIQNKFAMNTYTIEPVDSLDELEVLNIEETKRINSSDLSFIIKSENQIIGYAQLIPIQTIGKSKALWLQKVICTNCEATTTLLKETIMRSWELGFDAVFTDSTNNIPKNMGFIELESSRLKFDVKPIKVLAMELSWNGLRKFEKMN